MILANLVNLFFSNEFIPKSIKLSITELEAFGKTRLGKFAFD